MGCGRRQPPGGGPGSPAGGGHGRDPGLVLPALPQVPHPSTSSLWEAPSVLPNRAAQPLRLCTSCCPTGGGPLKARRALCRVSGSLCGSALPRRAAWGRGLQHSAPPLHLAGQPRAGTPALGAPRLRPAVPPRLRSLSVVEPKVPLFSGPRRLSPGEHGLPGISEPLCPWARAWAF